MQRNDARRRGFTLVELLVVISIIAMIAAFLLAGLYLAQNSARDARTKALISKIDAQISLRWQSYQTRPVPVDPAIIAQNLGVGFTAATPTGRARVILHAKRDMLRMEMPDRWLDITSPPLAFDERTAIAQRLFDWHESQSNLTAEHQSSECLYLVLTTSMPGAPSARHIFRPDDLDDSDGDGATEIVDAWGNSISYIRWAPGASHALNRDGTRAFNPHTAFAAPISDIQTGDPFNDHDPLDPMRTQPEAFALYPLIYSKGPSGRGELNHLPSVDYRFQRNDPYTGLPANIGRPSLHHLGDHFDNIHNHMLPVQ